METLNTLFWKNLELLADGSTLVVDRPQGSVHPRHPECIYPHDYGYLEEILSSDGAGLDVWLGSLTDRRLTGILCTVDMLKRDVEIKLLLGCTPAEMDEICRHQNQGFMSAVLLPRPVELE